MQVDVGTGGGAVESSLGALQTSPRTSKVRFKVENLSREASIESDQSSQESSTAEKSKDSNSKTSGGGGAAATTTTKESSTKLLDIKP